MQRSIAEKRNNDLYLKVEIILNSILGNLNCWINEKELNVCVHVANNEKPIF